MLITKLLTPKSPIDIKTVSRLFSSYENVSLRNVVIPIGYGRLKIGSIIIFIFTLASLVIMMNLLIAVLSNIY